MSTACPYRELFEPFAIKGFSLRNRVVMPPIVSVRNILGEDGRAWYREHAEGGPGLVIVEATPLGLLVDASLPALGQLVDAVHGAGALIAVQLYSNGRPDPSRAFFEEAHDPHELSRDQLMGLIGHFARAARVCREAGFDGVEPHGAHGYFLTRCFSPLHNRRTDDYGGTLDGRMRTALEVCRGVRGAIGDDMLLLFRHTPVEGEEGGYGLADTLQLARALVAEGVDVLDISPSHAERDGVYSEAVRRETGRPVIARGELDEPERAVAMLTNGWADLVAVGRGLIADAQWPNKVREGRLDEIVRCVRCDEKCFGHLEKRIPIACTQW